MNKNSVEYLMDELTATWNAIEPLIIAIRNSNTVNSQATRNWIYLLAELKHLKNKCNHLANIADDTQGLVVTYNRDNSSLSSDAGLDKRIQSLWNSIKAEEF